MLIWSFGSESLRHGDFALNSLGCGSPRCVLWWRLFTIGQFPGPYGIIMNRR